MFKRYLKDTSGQFAIMFSLSATALLVVTGVAVDIMDIHSKKSEYQDLSDAAVLAAAVSGEQDPAALQALAEVTVAELAGHSNYNVVLTVTPENSIQVVVSKPYKMKILSAITDDINISALAEAPPKGEVKLNVALVLDVTRSMEGEKLETLKLAATNLVNSFDEDSSDDSPDLEGDDDDEEEFEFEFELDDDSDSFDGDDGDDDDDGGDAPSGGGEDSDSVRFSVVPFARYVRVPMELADETWLDVEEPNESCWNKLDLEASQAAGTCTASSTESGGYSCTNAVYYEYCTEVQWWGCVTSRHYPWNTRHEVGPHKIPGFAGGGSCNSSLLPLTEDFGAVNNSINDLEADQETYIPSGLIWGWRTLMPEAPFVEADTEDYDERKHVMILMTDGENSKSYGGEKGHGPAAVFHWQSNTDAANQLTSDLCQNIKDDGIELYTIAFEVDSLDTQVMLQNCASSADKYFDAENADQLTTAFEDIGRELAAVRLTK